MAQSGGYTATLGPQGVPASHNFSTSDHLVLTAHGFDLGSGVQNVAVTGDYTLTCVVVSLSGEQVAQQQTGSLYEQTSVPVSGQGVTVVTNLYATLQLDFVDYAGECKLPEKYFKSMSGHARATAENHLGGKATSTEFTFKVAP